MVERTGEQPCAKKHNAFEIDCLCFARSKRCDSYILNTIEHQIKFKKILVNFMLTSQRWISRQIRTFYFLRLRSCLTFRGTASFGQFSRSISIMVVNPGDFGQGNAHPTNQRNGKLSTWKLRATQNASNRGSESLIQSKALLFTVSNTGCCSTGNGCLSFFDCLALLRLRNTIYVYARGDVSI